MGAKANGGIVTQAPVAQFHEHGHTMIAGYLGEAELAALCRLCDRWPRERSGGRDIEGGDRLTLANDGQLAGLAREFSGEPVQLLRAIGFDKSAEQNWFVPWHQDRSRPFDIEELPEEGIVYGRRRAGKLRAEATAEFLARMVTLRIHLDDCLSESGPLEVVPGSHTRGVLTREDIGELVDRNVGVCCIAHRGDILAMRPLLVHRSQRAAAAARRRILHLDFAPVRWSSAAIA